MKKRLRVEIEGRVQGVGFRPTVYRHARTCGVTGRVANSTQGVTIEAEGAPEALERFLALLRTAPPAQARIAALRSVEIPPAGDTTFAIAASVRAEGLSAQMPPDLALCAACRADILNPADRRHGYAFTNCTNCGPRFTIIAGLPYDRERTTMSGFVMCARCRAEYADAADRRFDAQPNACPACGPRLRLLDAGGNPLPGDPLPEAAARLRRGEILALKGLGGFHLACRTEEGPIARLRARKARPHKALAVMFRDLDELRRHCRADAVEEAELTSPAAPIVILDRREDSTLPVGISPDTRDVGAFLPYTPLHHLLLAQVSPLVMTSANRAEEPIARNADELGGILGPIADAALDHDRPILRRCDDSVLRVCEGRRLVIRRSRGFVPDAIALPLDGPCVLAVGADLKNVFAFTRGPEVFLSPHVGDLEEYAAAQFHREARDDLMRLFGVRPKITAHDLHPDYFSTRMADDERQTGDRGPGTGDGGRGTADDGREAGSARRVAVQHHHAHVAACMAEHGLTDRVIGVALDGAGYGPDGTVWGGEFLIADLRDFRRAARLAPLAMPGGDAATRQPARMALAVLHAWLRPRPNGPEGLPPPAFYTEYLPAAEAAALWTLLDRQLRCPLTSSAGRLFDAVAALLGLGSPVTYEGQAAIRLESLAEGDDAPPYAFDLTTSNDPWELSFAPAVREIVSDLARGEDRRRIAARFHRSVAAGVAATCAALREREGIESVALSGGVFQNRRLLRALRHDLEAARFRVYGHHVVPPNDGGIALGQAAIALARAGGEG